MRNITTLIALMGAVACGQANINESTIPAPDTVVLAIGDEPVGYHGLTLWFTEVPEDSRCSLDVTCVWAGNATVVLNTVVGGVERTLALHTSDDPEIGSRTAAFDGYRVTLLALDPQPVSDQPIPATEYRAQLELAIE